MSGLVNLVSIRFSNHLLDASTGQPKRKVYVTQGDPDQDWAKWKLVDRGGHHILESIRFPQHYLDASEGKPGKGNVYVTRGNSEQDWAQWKIIPIFHPPLNRSSLFLSSSGNPDQDALCSVIRSFWKEVTPQDRVCLVGLFDAKGSTLSELRDGPMFRCVKEAASEVARDLNLQQPDEWVYRFGRTFTQDEVSRCQKRCETKGSILVVLGGNTYALAHGMAKVPQLAQFIRRSVRDGNLLYTSFSAGTCFAGATTQIAVDPVEDLEGNPISMIKDGLKVCNLIFRPHSNQAGHAKGREIEQMIKDRTLTTDHGEKITRPVIYLRDNPKDVYAVVHGQVHPSSRILAPSLYPLPFMSPVVVGADTKKVCKFWLQGRCKRGLQCQYPHKVCPHFVVADINKVCKYWLQGRCKKGLQCQYPHKVRKPQQPCKNGANCPFAHVPAAP